MRRALPLFLTAAVVATTGCDAFREGFAKGRDAAIDKKLAEVSAEMNKTLPMMVDKDTQLDNAVAMPGKVLQYNYTLVAISASQVDTARLDEAFKPTLLNKVKTTPDMKPLREAGVTFIYNYRDKDGVMIVRYEFGPKDYNG